MIDSLDTAAAATAAAMPDAPLPITGAAPSAGEAGEGREAKAMAARQPDRDVTWDEKLLSGQVEVRSTLSALEERRGGMVGANNRVSAIQEELNLATNAQTEQRQAILYSLRDVRNALATQVDRLSEGVEAVDTQIKALAGREVS